MKERKLEFILSRNIRPLFFGLFVFLVWIISDYYYFRILIGCTHAKHFSFFLLTLIICSSWNLFSLWAEWKKNPHTRSHFLKNFTHKLKIPSRNWKITLRMWMWGGRKVKESLFFLLSRILIFARHFPSSRHSLPSSFTISADFSVSHFGFVQFIFLFTSGFKYQLTVFSYFSNWMFCAILVTDNFYGMGKEVENLISENNELLATKWDINLFYSKLEFTIIKKN